MSVIQYDDLSEESKEMLAKTGKKGENYKAKKLVNDFKPRIKYLCHISNLQFYLRKGLVLKKIRSLIKFEQDDFAATFIKMTTRLRKNAETGKSKFFTCVQFLSTQH